jgi:hypothetical protein
MLYFIKDAPDMDPKTKKIKVKSKVQGENIFELNTPSKIDQSVSLKYSFLFEFTDDKGKVKYGSIDPLSKTVPPPPPVYP